MAITMDGSNISFSGGGISLPLKYKDVYVGLNDATWTQSSAGMYYSTISDVVPNGSVILGATIASWGHLKSSDQIMISIKNNTGIYVLSNADTFYSSNSYIEIRVLYK